MYRATSLTSAQAEGVTDVLSEVFYVPIEATCDCHFPKQGYYLTILPLNIPILAPMPHLDYGALQKYAVYEKYIKFLFTKEKFSHKDMNTAIEVSRSILPEMAESLFVKMLMEGLNDYDEFEELDGCYEIDE